MKKTVTIIVLSLILIFSVSTAVADFKKNKIAVLDFQMQGKEYQDNDMGSIVAEWLITALVVACAAATAFSGGQYIVRGVSILKKKKG